MGEWFILGLINGTSSSTVRIVPTSAVLMNDSEGNSRDFIPDNNRLLGRT
jgi:hypothetical protein